MGMLDEKTRKRIDKEIAFDKEFADMREKELLDSLDAIGKEYVDENRPKKEDFAVEEKDFDYINYREKSDRELENEALKSLGRYEKKDFSDKYEASRREQAEKARKSGGEFAAEAAESRRAFDEAVKKIFRSSKGRGIADSSIKKLLADEAAELMGAKNADSAEKLKESLKKVEERTEAIDAAERSDEEKDEKAYFDMLEKDLKRIAADYAKEKSEADKTDAATAKAEEAYKKSVEKAKKDYENAVGDYVNRRAEREEKYGYEGEKKKNYERKLEAAKEFYLQLPKEEALRRIRSNMPLKNELGHLYASLLQSVMKEE